MTPSVDKFSLNLEPVDKLNRIIQATFSADSKRFNIKEIIAKYIQDSSVFENIS
jgi:hypothetical protein